MIMAAIGIHVARVAALAINPLTNQRIDKESPTTTIADTLRTEHRHVILPDSDIPNSANYPEIAAYLKLEAASGYAARHISQNLIVTYEGL